MDLKKTYDRTGWKVMWNVLTVYDLGGRLQNGVKAFYKDGKTCIRVNGETNESFGIQECG